jgi:hypothetical protein
LPGLGTLLWERPFRAGGRHAISGRAAVFVISRANDPGRRNGETAVAPSITPKYRAARLLWAAAVLAAAMGFDIPAGRAAGTAPWCAVIEYDEDVTWECYYRTVEECYPNVLAGNKGSCTQNPAWHGPPTFASKSTASKSTASKSTASKSTASKSTASTATPIAHHKRQKRHPH